MSRKVEAENVYVFVADSLREDFLPQNVAKRGITFTTIASSTYTPPSFASMFTGLYPPKHGVYSFSHRVRKGTDTLLDLDTGNRSATYHSPTVWVDGPNPLHRVLGIQGERRLKDLEPPFVHVEHDCGGHCPYGGFGGFEGDCGDSFEELGRAGGLRDAYRRGVESSAERFLEKMDYLEDRGLLEDTLVIFTSDHGELLGEYGGLVAHCLPMTPELVYVPTVLMHPDLPENEVSPRLGRGVDIFPTALGALGEEAGQIDGVNLLSDSDPGPGYSFVANNVIKSRESSGRDRLLTSLRDRAYVAEGLWGPEGGHVFHRSGKLKRLGLSMFHNVGKGNTSRYVRGRGATPSDYISMMKRYLKNHHTYGTPPIDRTAADNVCNGIREHSVEPDTGESLDEEVQEQLEKLGYL